jgi:hypothetical protein
MKKFVVYDELGRIVRSGTCQDQDFGVQAIFPGEGVIEGECRDAVDFVDLNTMEITTKPPLPATRNGMVISGLPDGSTVSIGAESFLVLDNEVELEFEFPGTYIVRCEAVNYLPKTFEVTV